MRRQITRLSLTLLFGVGSVIACELRPDNSFDDIPLDVRDDQLTPKPRLTSWGWTEFTSEERPPIGCDGTGMVAGFGCTGSYCDNARLYCANTGHTGYGAYWTSYFSEEKGEDNNFRRCHDDYWMVGLACSGPYCDRLALQCRYFPTTSAACGPGGSPRRAAARCTSAPATTPAGCDAVAPTVTTSGFTCVDREAIDVGWRER